MNFILLFTYFSYCLYVASGITNFQGFFKQGSPCFKTVKVPKCNKTLAESFKPSSPMTTGNEPATLAFLFPPRSKNIAEPLHLCGGELPPRSKFDPKAKTEIFIHGWLDGVCRTAWMREMKEQLFKRGRYNVILIDWTWGNFPDFKLASDNCKIVGEQVGFIMNNIMRQTGVGPETFHVVGHSFGGIAAGFAGRGVNRQLGKITALDPAYAPFGDAPPDQRLTREDAQTVVVIHTNAHDPPCFLTNHGDPRHLGHADFYPNGGFIQKSCFLYILRSILKGDFLYALVSLDPRLCFHLQATQFYKVSINTKKDQMLGFASKSYDFFKKHKSDIVRNCNDAAVMGMDFQRNFPKEDNKTYYLDTTLCCPYNEKNQCGK